MAQASKIARRALVTGASSGLGSAFAERLANDQYSLTIVARRVVRLEELAANLNKKYATEVEVVQADLADRTRLKSLEEKISHGPPLDLLVNNAGFGGYQPFINLDPDKADELIRLQITAVTRLTRAALPAMIANRRGAIINVSSRLAYTGSLAAPSLPKRAVYAATKAYINTFTQILHSELAGTGVRVQALCPGVIATEFHERMGIDISRIPPSIVMKPQDVVEASLVSLLHDEVVCVPTLEDTSLLDRVHEGHLALWEKSNSGRIADRYSANSAQNQQ
jgi:short-subunit dehydrogenase